MNAPDLKTLIFIGPSLSKEEAKALYPEAWIHEPARCGDLLKAIRLAPRRIAIIDGYFEHTASPWHKEILFALSLGIEVFGASSMGALRALELEPFGMRGVGKIFDYLKETRSSEDDEVCLAHSEDYLSQTPTLCNLRFTLEKAVSEQIISEEEAEFFMNKFKNLPYFERSFEIIKHPKLSPFLTNSYIDQKKLDAIELISMLSKTPCAPPKKSYPFAPTLFFYKIFREMSSTPFYQDYDWLPESEQALSRLQTVSWFSAQKRLSKLFHLVYDLSRLEKKTRPSREDILDWARKMHLQHPISIPDERLLAYLASYDLCLLENRTLCRLTLMIFKGLLAYLTQEAFEFYPHAKQALEQFLKKEHRLTSEQAIEEWIKTRPYLKLLKHESALEVFHEMARFLTPLHWLVELNNGHYLGIAPSLAAISWLKISSCEEAEKTIEVREA